MTLLATLNQARTAFALLAAIANLSLAVTAAIAGRKSVLARPIARLSSFLFAWNLATVVQHRFGDLAAFRILDVAFTALSPPAVLDVVLAFTGTSRRAAIPRGAAWAGFGLLGLSSVAGFISAQAYEWLVSPGWAALFLVAYVPTLAFEVITLARYLRRAPPGLEAARARIVGAALAIGSACAMSDVVHEVGYPVPYLGALGTFVSAALLATLVVRLELFDRNVSLRTALYVVGMIAAFVVGYLVVLTALAGRLALQLSAVAILTVLGVVVARELALSRAETRARVQRFTLLGRFAAQMSHDVKGPLTALLGAVQVLEDADDSLRDELLPLVAEQARRIAGVVERYDRMTRIEPRTTRVRVNEVVRAVARTHAVTSLSLADEAGECEADAALLETALENVVRNAREASEDVALSTLRSNGRVLVRVVDRGPGMDARVLERATEEFFTTKAQGSGLGLSFARRVLEAHRGSLTITSRPGRGTTVELELPG